MLDLESDYSEEPKKRINKRKPSIVKGRFAKDPNAADPNLFERRKEKLPVKDMREVIAAEKAVRGFVDNKAEGLKILFELVDRDARNQEMSVVENENMIHQSCVFQGNVYRLARKFSEDDDRIDLVFKQMAERLHDKIKEPYSQAEVTRPLINGGLGMVTAEVIFKELTGKGSGMMAVHDIHNDKYRSTDLMVEVDGMMFLLQIKSSSKNGSGMLLVESADNPVIFEGKEIGKGELERMFQLKRELDEMKTGGIVIPVILVVPAAGVGKVRPNGMMNDESLVERYRPEFDRIMEKYAKN